MGGMSHAVSENPRTGGEASTSFTVGVYERGYDGIVRGPGQQLVTDDPSHRGRNGGARLGDGLPCALRAQQARVERLRAFFQLRRQILV